MQKKTSLKDIARQVGVSAALVSYVLNNRKQDRISKAVAEKIRAVAAQLNYRPNQAARSLKTSRTLTIGLIVADIANPFSSALARIIEDEADKKGYTVIFGSSDENLEKFTRLLDTLLNRQVDGLILSPPSDAASQLQLLMEQRIPFVLLDRYFPGINAHSVCLDNKAATTAAIRYLTGKGKRRIGMIAYSTPLAHLQDRISGYLEGLEEAGLPKPEALLKKVDIHVPAAQVHEALLQLLHQEDPPEAILCSSNRIATTVLLQLHGMRDNIPSPPEIVGFDETDLFFVMDPPLTYIRQPLEEMGRLATSLLLESITGDKSPTQLFIPGELVKAGNSRQSL